MWTSFENDVAASLKTNGRKKHSRSTASSVDVVRHNYVWQMSSMMLTWLAQRVKQLPASHVHQHSYPVNCTVRSTTAAQLGIVRQPEFETLRHFRRWLGCWGGGRIRRTWKTTDRGVNRSQQNRIVSRRIFRSVIFVVACCIIRRARRRFKLTIVFECRGISDSVDCHKS